MDRLWSPWRLEYVTRAEQKTGCIFCEASRPPSGGATHASPLQSDSLIVFEGSLCYVILNLYPYNNGHLMVVPYRHVATLAGLSPEELEEIGRLTQHSEMALMEAYEPHGMNIGINLGKSAGAGVQEHLHVHVVPRWSGDTNFITVVGNMRVLPEDLSASAKRLRPIFANLNTSR